ncbi:MAG: AEC family transporter [Clostridiales bacterium]
MIYNFYFTANNVLPVFIMILIGYIIKKRGFLKEGFSENINILVFNVAMPALIFSSIYDSDFFKIFNLQLVILGILGTLIVFFTLMIIAKLFIRDNKSKGVFIQGGFRSNFVIIGLPLIYNLFSEEGVSKAIILITFIMPLYNILAIIVLTIFSGNIKEQSIKNILLKIVKNPLIISAIIALPFSIGNSYGFKMNIPFFEKSLEYLANIAIPLALLDIGFSFEFKLLIGKLKMSLIATMFKIILSPLIFMVLSYFMGVRGEMLGIIYIMSASPTAISSYIMAKAMKCDSQLAAAIVITSTFLSLITIFIGVYILKTMMIIK